MKIEYFKCSPGGNITALVTNIFPINKHSIISDKIMNRDKTIEQVGFIEKSLKIADNARLQMMGTEFCGNATRALGWVLYKLNKKKTIKIEVSGTNKILEIKIRRGNVQVEMPIKKSFNSIKKDKILLGKKLISVTIVKLEGITHILIDSKNKKINTKDEAKKIIKYFRLIKGSSCGVINYSYSKNKIKIIPFVWVRKINKITKETACASGAIALAQAIAKEKKKTSIIKIVQPSNIPILANVIIKKNKFSKGFISGKVKIIKRESIDI